MTKPVSIFLVEDHVIVRNGIKGLIEQMGDYQVSGEFDNGKQLIAKIDEELPDLVIMDLSMPVMDGLATTRWLKEQGIACPVLILTLDTSDKTIIELYRAGVRGYLPKTCTADVLKRAIDDIIEAGYHHNDLLSHAMVKSHGSRETQTPIHFSDREITFLRLVCDKQEYTYEQIAREMNVHRRTVDSYRESLFERYNIKSKTGLVMFAIKHGIVTID